MACRHTEYQGRQVAPTWSLLRPTVSLASCSSLRHVLSGWFQICGLIVSVASCSNVQPPKACTELTESCGSISILGKALVVNRMVSLEIPMLSIASCQGVCPLISHISRASLTWYNPWYNTANGMNQNSNSVYEFMSRLARRNSQKNNGVGVDINFTLDDCVMINSKFSEPFLACAFPTRKRSLALTNTMICSLVNNSTLEKFVHTIGPTGLIAIGL
mmetsp:Transcript_11851/g.19305  ORF Transcript_11851/g.19305 Transcript_11851/m.19305 type:complete len:217 (-) Transcript_11851:1309-1959(-)